MAKAESDDSIGFEVLAPDPFRMCRIIRGRRYRPVRTVGRCAHARSFGGETVTIEITEMNPDTPPAHDATSIGIIVDVTISGASTLTSSERRYGFLKMDLRERRIALSFCPFGGGLGRRFSPLASIRGGASPGEEEEDTDVDSEDSPAPAEQEQEDMEFDPDATNEFTTAADNV